MHERFPVHLAGGGLEEGSPAPMGQLEQVGHAAASYVEDLEGEGPEVDRGSGAGQINDRIDSSGNWHVSCHIGFHELEPRATQQAIQVGDRPGDEVVYADNLVTAV
jgi:hypothetical protein